MFMLLSIASLLYTKYWTNNIAIWSHCCASIHILKCLPMHLFSYVGLCVLICSPYNVTNKKLPNVYKSCPKNYSSRKMKDFWRFTKMPKLFGQNICCHWLWKVAQSGITCPIWSHCLHITPSLLPFPSYTKIPHPKAAALIRHQNKIQKLLPDFN